MTPTNWTPHVGGTQQFSATAQYSDGTSGDVTQSVTWASSATDVAAINTSGLASALKDGSATITATATSGNAQVVASATVTVYDPPPPPPPPPATAVNVVTWHYDNQRTGLNANETVLTPANVNAEQFGKLFSYTVDGLIYAQPLYVSGLTINGATHNVVFVSTEKNNVYAFDADNYGDGSPLWQTSLLQPGETLSTQGSIKPYHGSTSTPVIDLNTNTMYVVTTQNAPNGPAYFALHALDIQTGQEKARQVITASVPSTTSSTGVAKLTTSCIQRAALLLQAGTIYMGFSACGNGWVLAYDAATLTQTAVFNTSPNLTGYGPYPGAGGVWMGGGGPVVDSAGNIYVTTGDGPYDGQTAFGDSILKFDSTLHLLDFFTPAEYAYMQCEDQDLSGGGALILPGTTDILAGGKSGKLFLVDTTNLGHGPQPNNAGAIQTLYPGTTNTYSEQCTNSSTGEVLNGTKAGYQIFATGAWFNNSVYVGFTPGPLRQLTFANGTFTLGSVTPDPVVTGSYGTSPVISANGTSDGIVWMIDHGIPLQASTNPPGQAPTHAVLRAYDASDLTRELYDSNQNASDAPGYGIKFSTPIVANGKVFMASAHDTLAAGDPQGELDVYGLR